MRSEEFKNEEAKPEVAKEIKREAGLRTNNDPAKEPSKKVYLITPLATDFPIDPMADYIGVDAGCMKILQAGLSCRMAIGDFDSLKEKLPEDLMVEILPVRKDEPDSESAIKLALSLGYTQIILWGGISGRLDHTFANLRLICEHYPRVILADASNLAFVLEPGIHEMEDCWKHVSFFALEPSILTLKGFDYPLEQGHIDQKDLFTLSNRVLPGHIGKAIVEKGKVLCICSQNL